MEKIILIYLGQFRPRKTERRWIMELIMKLILRISIIVLKIIITSDLTHLINGTSMPPYITVIIDVIWYHIELLINIV